MPTVQFNTKIIDPEAIANLEELSVPGEESILKQLIDLFLTSAPKALDNMKVALDGDLKQIRREAHTLKSSSGGLGAFKVSELCNQIEYAPQEFDKDKFAPMLDDLRALLSEATTELVKLR